MEGCRAYVAVERERFTAELNASRAAGRPEPELPRRFRFASRLDPVGHIVAAAVLQHPELGFYAGDLTSSPR
jgi:hypothetical protein